MREIFGLQEIEDSDKLKVEIQRRMASMNAIQRAEINMRIGTKVGEAEARTPGAKYSPPTQALLIKSVFCLMLASGSIVLILYTRLPLVFKLVTGTIGVIWLLMSWRATARVIYRSRNNRDW